MEKPITLQVDEFKKNIIDVINNSNLPAIILDFILKDVYTEIHSAYQVQFETDKKSYEESLKNEKNEDIV